MRSLLLASLVLAGTASAQAPINYFEIYSGCINFTSRGVLGANPGDVLLQVPSAYFKGIGMNASGSGTILRSFQYVLQDQNAGTQETYTMVVRGDNAGAPDCTPAGVLLQTGPLMPPTGSGIVAWQLTTNLATPSNALPLMGVNYYIGANLPGNAAWTADGLSIHMSSYYLLNGTQADNPAPAGTPGVVNLAWNCLNGAPAQPASFRTYRVALGVETAVFNIGNDDPTLLGNTSNCVATALGNRSFGVGGLWPAIATGGRSDGSVLRVRDLANANGLFVPFVGTGGFGGVPIPSIGNGLLFLNPGFALVALGSATLSATGVGIFTPPFNVPSYLAGQTFNFQAFSVGPGFQLPGNFSNGGICDPK